MKSALTTRLRTIPVAFGILLAGAAMSNCSSTSGPMAGDGGGETDATNPDARPDVATSDAKADSSDSSSADAHTDGPAVMDAGADREGPDTGARDTGAPDTGAPDTGAPDTGAPDTGPRDSGPVDTGAPDTGARETGAPETGAPDTGAPDTGAPDTGPTAECAVASDCPQPTNDCLAATCVAGVCGMTNRAAEATCSFNGGSVCDGNGSCVACLQPSDCPASGTVCATLTCDANTCGTTSAMRGISCEGAGNVCDGNGNCVASHCNDGVQDADETDLDCGGPSCGPCLNLKKCAVAGDCISRVCDPTAKTCTPPTCSDGVQNGAETGVDCGGATCDGQNKTCADRQRCLVNADCANGTCFGGGLGTCVSCTDGVRDGTETGVDCGGPLCDGQSIRCGVDQKCSVANDCASAFCETPAGTCQLIADGQACTSNAQCLNSHCIGLPGSQVCCNSACNGTCQGCTMAQTGLPTGTCGNLLAGSAAPIGQCLPTPPCGNTGLCAAGGVCQLGAIGTLCGSSSCASGELTAPGMCSGAGSCLPGGMSACPNGLKCASATSCLASCSADTDCQSSTTYCNLGTCAPQHASGAVCAADDQCLSSLCGPTGGTGTHCCNNGTTCPATVSACGATDCAIIAGTCVYPGTTVAPASLQTAGDCQVVVCNGSGGDQVQADPTDIPGPSSSACLVNPHCTGTTPTYDAASAGTPCTGADPNAFVCGDPAGINAGLCVECNVDTDCLAINDAGTLVCNTTTNPGVCE